MRAPALSGCTHIFNYLCNLNQSVTPLHPRCSATNQSITLTRLAPLPALHPYPPCTLTRLAHSPTCPHHHASRLAAEQATLRHCPVRPHIIQRAATHSRYPFPLTDTATIHHTTAKTTHRLPRTFSQTCKTAHTKKCGNKMLPHFSEH